MILIIGVNILASFALINLFYALFTLFKFDIFILKNDINLYFIYAFIAFFIINFITF